MMGDIKLIMLITLLIGKNGYVIPREAENSDLSSSVALIKDRATEVLLEFQSRGNHKE